MPYHLMSEALLVTMLLGSVPLQYGLVIQVVMMVVVVVVAVAAAENQIIPAFLRVKACRQNCCGIFAVRLHEPVFMLLLQGCNPRVNHSCCVYMHLYS
jgi:hypothetical protein